VKDIVLKEYHLKCPKSATNITTFPRPNSTLSLTTQERYKIHTQNKRMLTKIITKGVFGTNVPQHSPKLGFRLLATSVEIYKKLCPIVPGEFIQSAFQVFHDLHWSTSQGRTDLLRKAEYKWILKLLRKCSAYIKPVHVRTDACGEVVLE